MSVETAEIEYAEEQISEAERRLEGIQNRVGKTRLQFTQTTENGSIEKTEFYTSGEIDEEYWEEKLIQDRENYEKEYVQTVDDELIDAHIQNVVIDCQLCIEIAAKSLFKLTGKDHPFSHGISFNDGRTQGFYNKVPEEFERKEDIVRVIFLTQFWSEFYELAKYGAPQLNVRPEMVFTTEDASRAVQDADFCVDVVKDFLEYTRSNIE